MRELLLVPAVCLGLLATQPTYAQTILERAESDQITMMADGDPDMQLAFKRAQTTLGAFLALVHDPRPTIETMAVKVGVHEADNTEYFWLSPLRAQGDHFVGNIDNEPRSVHNVSLGQAIAFKKDDIVDWFYTENGKMLGNFTACAMLEHEPPDQAKEFMHEFGLSCDP